MITWDTLKKKVVAAVQRVGPYVETATEIGETVVHLPDKPGTVHYAALAAKVTQQALMHSASSIGSGRWCVPFPNTASFDDLLPDLIKEEDPGIEIPSSESRELDRNVSYHQIDGYEFRIEHTQDSIVFVRPHQKDDVIKLFGKMLWKKFGDSLRVAPVDSKDGGVSFDGQASIPLSSCLAHNILYDLGKYKGEPKSILLYGPPGTGKSCVAKFCAHELGGRTLLIEPHVLSDYFVCLDSLLKMMDPDILILDDLDRVESSSYLLSLFERIRGPDTVTMATVNDTSMLDRALLRPGRFDELIEIEQAPQDVVDKLLGRVPERLHETVSSWEPAYLSELIRRIERNTDSSHVDQAVESLQKHRTIERKSEFKMES